jgi:hypothetical protein
VFKLFQPFQSLSGILYLGEARFDIVLAFSFEHRMPRPVLRAKQILFLPVLLVHRGFF